LPAVSPGARNGGWVKPVPSSRTVREEGILFILVPLGMKKLLRQFDIHLRKVLACHPLQFPPDQIRRKARRQKGTV
jgi:hypothetical protein